MHEIRFRAWDKINKQYIPHKLLSVCLKNIGNSNQFIYEQYTGLKDKNGKEIYEGDIVMARSIYGWMTKKEVEEFGLNLRNSGDLFEIIGTIHDLEID
jgi:hypothetical protein